MFGGGELAQRLVRSLLMLHIFTSIWVLRTPYAGQNMLFHRFCAKKLEKEGKAKNFGQVLAKNVFF